MIKLETNLDALKAVGIDLKLAGLLEINTTNVLKTETLTLEGIPGQVFNQIASSSPLIDDLNAGTLPSSIDALFTGENDLSDTATDITITTVIGNALWRIEDASTGKTFFIQLQDVTPLPTQANPTPTVAFELQLRNETQTFDLEPKTLLVAA